MDHTTDCPSPDDFEADDMADRSGVGGYKLMEFLAGVGAFLTAVLAVGGGIYVLLGNAGTLHGVNAPPAIGAAVARPTSIQPSAAPTEALRAGATTIYRCEVNGKTVYANAPCSSRNIRPVDVFVNEGFEATDTSTLLTRRPPTDQPATVASSNDSATAQRCKWIEEAIMQNEETAKVPQSGWMQDHLTEEKRKLLDEKHDLQC